MVGANEAPGLTASLDQARQPVPADIGEGADAVLVADREDRLVGDLERDEFTGRVKLVLAADTMPFVAEMLSTSRRWKLPEV